ncbi:hypothetical protein FX985_03643 [Pseudomonas extremaustralis]|uniref:Uncharacterized protein n=1 Tax=Pseudomonas extremaustralis TaxID=359110 RepID=A0A5M9J5W9_9PSED|nr:hypothetical protein [Pseudomonas extremaustralis]KAA8563573.1 hypothetical protein FX985_03643 [Pseudomonas extremaustralis]
MRQTTGSVNATITNNQVIPPKHDFKGDADRMQMYFEGTQLHIKATESIGGGINEMLGFDFVIADIVNDGVMRTYKFDTYTRGLYWAHENGGLKPYVVETGSLRLSLDKDNRLMGTFDFSATFNDFAVDVEKGEIDLVGFIIDAPLTSEPQNIGTGHMTGKVEGGPMPKPEFYTTVVSVRKIESHIKKYWEVAGFQEDGSPPIRNIILIVINEGTTNTSFNLATSTEVRVAFGRTDAFGFAYAISGSLDFTALPGTGRTEGRINCKVQRNEETPFAVIVKFDITDSV